MASTQSPVAPPPAAVPIQAGKPGGRSDSITSLSAKDRSDSVSSIGSSISSKGRSSSVVSVPESPVAESPVSYWSYGRRESRGQFASLMDLKRSNNPAQQAIRDGIHDQRRTPGYFGRMWHQYVYGDTILTRRQ